MRKLEEHFCTFEQSEKLAELGLKHFAALLYWNKENGYLKLGNSGLFTVCRAPLRSQALDFFRDKSESYKWLIDRDYQKYIKPDNEYETVEEAESALIDKLIELETEAQHGK